MLKAILVEQQQWYYLTWGREIRRLIVFPRLSPKGNIIVWLKFKLLLQDHSSAMGTPSNSHFVYIYIYMREREKKDVKCEILKCILFYFYSNTKNDKYENLMWFQIFLLHIAFHWIYKTRVSTDPQPVLSCQLNDFSSHLKF